MDRSSTEYTTPQQWRWARPNLHAAHDIPESWINLDEIEAIPPLENPDERPVYHHTSLEETRGQGLEHSEEQTRRSSHLGVIRPDEQVHHGSRKASTETGLTSFETQLYVHSYLVMFSILGTLARKGLAALTIYPGTPIIFDTIWVNFTGCLIMGFIVEDRKLFLYEWGSPTYHEQLIMEERRQADEESGASSGQEPIDLDAAKEAFMSNKKSIPLYIGLTTGFCGSFTTFSGFVLNLFLALSNGLVSPPASSATDRNGAYSFMAVTGVGIATVSISLSGLIVGAQLAIAVESAIPSLPYNFMRKYLDRFAILGGWASWVGAVLLCVLPPHDDWRGRITFALVFSPLGAFVRFYLALFLNGRSPSFPIGTFAANVLASAILALSWDINHAAIGSILDCQVLYGIEDGFSGCLSTVSTWVVELTSLRRKHAYIYGLVSVFACFSIFVLISGSEKWSMKLSGPQCSS